MLCMFLCLRLSVQLWKGSYGAGCKNCQTVPWNCWRKGSVLSI